ncbi:ABC transporter ATP-binding protein [Effusibacillus lacus]|uniref:ABC transporter ATP-binding protein n=1 Tax=Effusibacillus lacus TaxID=1348429 RepID=A0A292YKW6_9BACL|nr:ABC transporter ATP-binding protein [Effusibacillus lacus]TCS75552.1 amino acid/amide ABC transporter ATP-binding protein 2 (HAAT family) [Effusibacillus lacus]GAX89014.1 ABC transporter ATP-binding protein [Effusibacillus lacus]
MLKLEDINLFYGEVQALWNISLEVQEGETVALLGANAAGKSTTINAISGLEKITSGRILYQGEEIHGKDPHEIVELGIVQVPEGRKLFSFMTIEENLELGAYSHRARKDFKKNLEMVYELFPVLQERRKQQAGSMSGGQQQMCAIARGLMGSPKVLMIDELSLGLAPIIVKKLFDVIKEIRQSGITVLLVEQNVNHSLAISDKGYVLENGRVALSGNASDLLADPYLKRAYLGM